MTKRYYNKLRMYIAVLKVLTDNRSKWEAIPMYNTEIGEFSDHVGLIDKARDAAGQTTNGITEDKHLLKEEIIDLSLDIAGQLHSMAARAVNNQLMAATDFEESDLEKGHDADLMKTTKNIVALARQNIDNLANYGTTTTEIDQLEQLCSLFEQKDTEPRTVVSERKSAGESLSLLIKDADSLLEDRIDKMMKKFSRTDSEFYSTYKNARMIVDYGIRHKKDNTKKKE